MLPQFKGKPFTYTDRLFYYENTAYFILRDLDTSIQVDDHGTACREVIQKRLYNAQKSSYATLNTCNKIMITSRMAIEDHDAFITKFKESLDFLGVPEDACELNVLNPQTYLLEFKKPIYENYFTISASTFALRAIMLYKYGDCMHSCISQFIQYLRGETSRSVGDKRLRSNIQKLAKLLPYLDAQFFDIHKGLDFTCSLGYFSTFMYLLFRDNSYTPTHSEYIVVNAEKALKLEEKCRQKSI